MSAERIYRLLLRAYPPAFRAEYGREMVLVFRDQCRDGDVRTLGFWTAVIYDVARSAPEWVAGSKGAIDGRYALAVVLGVLASALLLGAGVAILLRRQQAARLALFASLVSLVAARLLFPWMSIFSQLVGFGLPVGLLITLYWPRRTSPAGAA